MIIKTVKIQDLIPAEYNPRRDLQQADPEYKKIQASMREFGYVDPIVWNERTGHVVGGHQRLKVLQSQGVAEVKVSVVDIPETKEKALNLALNKISGDWETDKLRALLEDLVAFDYDMEITGFDADELDAILLPMDFEEFDECGDGGGSIIGDSNKVRVVIGSLFFDIVDIERTGLYNKTKAMDLDQVRERIIDLINELGEP